MHPTSPSGRRTNGALRFSSANGTGWLARMKYRLWDGRPAACHLRRRTVLGMILGLLVAGSVLMTVAYLPPLLDDDAIDTHFDIRRLAALANNVTGGRAVDVNAAGANSSLEIWARGPGARKFDAAHARRVMSYLTGSEVEALRALCGRCLYHSMEGYVAAHGTATDHVFVATGDIDDEWLRDSAIQLAIYLPRIAAHPALRQVIESAIRTQAYFILQDPYANAFNRKWRALATRKRHQRERGKGGWVAEHKYELDSGAYWINLLWNYYNTPGLYDRERLFSDPVVHDAARVLLDVWTTEQHHEERSPYRYLELERDGLGAPTNYTGMSWGGFRPSDDPQTYGYNIPVNMYAAGALNRLRQMNAATWNDAELDASASALVSGIRSGIETFGIVTAPDGTRVYAYEVDGFGAALLDFDDPNLPSLLAMPLLGYEWYDRQAYANTRQRVLSGANPYMYRGSHFHGLGSPHTPNRFVWPLAHMVASLTSPRASEQAELMRQLLGMQCGNGLMHESVHVDWVWRCTRPVFEWANAMLVVLVEQVLGMDCDVAAQEVRLRNVVRREWSRLRGPRGGLANLLSYERMEAFVRHE